MVTNSIALGCFILAGVLSVNANNAVEKAEPLAAGLATQASIWLLRKGEDTRVTSNVFLCSASIIETDHVLTHAKCVEYYKADDLRVALGTADLSTTETFFEVKSITYENDTEMALIRTPKDKFVKASVATLRDKPLGATSKCLISGWLNSATPWKQQEVTYIADAECKEQYEATHATVEEGSVCAQSTTEQNCGSVGMPLTCDDQLTGLFSLTNWECKLPAQCTGVPHSKAWIQKQLALAKGGASGMRPSLFVATIAALLVAYKALA